MDNYIKKILSFRLPRWEDLPDDGLLSSQVIEYINKTLAVLDEEKTIITKSMIQNYFKWGVLPPIKGRKYNRNQIAYLIIISIFKQVIPINDFKKGVILQQNKTTVERAYNHFAKTLEQSLYNVFTTLGEKNLSKWQVISEEINYLGIECIAQAFAFKLLGLFILYSDENITK